MQTDQNTIIQTERLFIRSATVAHADMYLALWTNPQVMTNVGFPFGLRITKDEIEVLLGDQPESAFGRLLVIERKDMSQPIGECRMENPDENGVATTDVKLLPDHWGHKFGIEVKRALVQYLFEHTDCSVVQASPNIDNLASIKMQEAVGGVRVGEGVGTFPESMHDTTRPVHHYVYQVSRSDWLRQRK